MHERQIRLLLPATALLALAAGPVLGQQFVQETATRFPSPNPTEYTNQITIGDLDGDGDLDIVFANGSGFTCPVVPQKARVYINDGSGFFADETDARTGGFSAANRGVELGDCDNDGDLDLLLVQDCDGLPGLLINDGTGFFADEGATRLPNITLSSSRGQFGDVDNDGDLDLFITSGTSSRFDCGQYRVYLNDGSCQYVDATATNFPVGAVCNNMDAIFGDIDNDFDIDIRTASTGTDNSRLYRNDGTGVFAEVPGIPADSTCYSYDFGDMDGDGDLDLLGVNALAGSSMELLLENDGTGAYADVSGQISVNPNQDDNDSKFIDYDNDGDLDLLVGRLGSGGEKLYDNDGAGNFTQVFGVVEVVSDSTLDVVVADLTGNGAYDFVTGQGESGNFQNRIYINNGPADTLPPTVVDTEQVPDSIGPGPYVVRTLVLDGMTSDRNFFDKGIELRYAVNDGPEQSAPMRHSGGQVYRGEIPGQSVFAEIDYYVAAADFNDNVASGATRSFLTPNCTAQSHCSANGSCVADDSCNCDPGWQGADCSQELPLPAGAVPDGTGPTARPLVFAKNAMQQVRLSWDASCGVNDQDFAIYQGFIGDFTNHEPLTCDNGGLTRKIIPASGGNRYYLVVPTSLNREGGYGTDSGGADRPVSPMACEPQLIGTCP